MKLRLLAIVGILVVLVLGLVLLYNAWRGPVIQWAQEREVITSLAAPLRPETDIAKWQRLGTNAVPVLSKALERPLSPLDKAYASVWSHLPLTIRSNLARPLDPNAIRMRASFLLAQSNIGGSTATSTLARELQDTNWCVRVNALACLNNAILPESGPDRLGKEKEEILALVLAAAHDRRMEVRMSSVYSLGFFNEASNRVLPVLSQALTDDYPDVRVRAAIAFYGIDPAGAEKAGALSTALDCLQYDGPHGSKWLAADFLRQEGKLPRNETE
jgi:HEAT repeat protein